MSSIIGAEGSKDFYWRESGVWMRDCLLNTYYFWLNKWFILMVYSVRSSLHQNKNRKGQRDGIKNMSAVLNCTTKRRGYRVWIARRTSVFVNSVCSLTGPKDADLKILYPRCQLISHLLILGAVCATSVLTLV